MIIRMKRLICYKQNKLCIFLNFLPQDLLNTTYRSFLQEISKSKLAKIIFFNSVLLSFISTYIPGVCNFLHLVLLAVSFVVINFLIS